MKLYAEKVMLGIQGTVGISLCKNSNGINPWIHYGYNDVSSHTQIIDFLNKTQDELWGALSQTARQLIKKAEKKCIVEEVDWKDHLDRYYELHKITYAKSKLLPHPYEYFQLIASLPSENHKLFAAFNQNGQVIAYHNDLYFKGNVWYHTAASSDEGTKESVHYLLTWTAIKSAYITGCQHYEVGEVFFGESTEKIKKISFFKTRFGGKSYRLYRGEKIYIHQPHKKALAQVFKSLRELINTFRGHANV